MDRRDFLVSAGALAAGLGANRVARAQTPATPAERLSIEQRLADNAVATRYENLSPEVVAAAKRLLTDTIACALGAVGAPPARIAEATFRKTFPGVQTATIIGGRELISTEGATLVNGVLTRYLDLNDIYVGRDPSHPSECIPSALAIAEETGASGPKLIEAIVVGYETQLSLIDAFSFSDRGFHSLSTAGYAVPLIAGKLWGLSRDQMVEAIGVAAPRQLTTLAINSGRISMMKAFGYASNAVDSIFATRLAAAGFTGATDVAAWFAANVKGKRPDAAFAIDPAKPRITKVGLKRFPLQFELQTVAEAGVELNRKLRGRAGDIVEILVDTMPSTIERTATPARYQPKTRETADHSLPVCLALALMEGDVTEEQFEHDRWKDAGVLALAQKVKARASDALVAKDARGAAIVTVKLSDGATHTVAVEIADGDPRRPMAPASLEGKFMQFAVPRLGEAGARHAFSLVGELEKLDDARKLTRALRPA